MTIPNARDKKLQADRVEFKLYSAEQHLNRLKEIENSYSDIGKDNVRIEVEMEMDCFLSHVLGAIDSLLSQINDKLDLGIPRNRVNFVDLQSALIAKTKQIDLLSELDRARQQGNWLQILVELGNQSVYGSLLKTVTSLSSSSPKNAQFRFLIEQSGIGDNPLEQVIDTEAIPYLEKSLHQIRAIISSIRARDVALQ